MFLSLLFIQILSKYVLGGEGRLVKFLFHGSWFLGINFYFEISNTYLSVLVSFDCQLDIT